MSLRHSASYVWSVSELIGQGATGNVFICRSKNSGKAFAAKVFNCMGQMRAKEVRVREIELLRKLSHPNIVKLEGEELEISSKATVLVMELCETSLYNILELPENYYGLSEEEFKNVFQDVANGMKCLKEQKIVHRDVKPGNILKKRCIEGRSVFKLTDFGAARELQIENQRFVSIYGTEEYLHPDVYEKAVMKNFSNKSFDAAVDMWSMGVTFYHAATGQLPFRPYGGRQNKETMFEIISKKGPGIISGVQKTNAGRIDYDEDLPEDTRMSKALKTLLKPALQELLETNAERLEHMISFDHFYRRVDDIVHRKVIDLYCTGSGTWYKIYMKKNETFGYFQEQIFEQTGINPENQLLFHSSKEISQTPRSSCFELVTTRDVPLIVIGGDFRAVDEIYQRRIPHPPRMPKGKTRPDNDIDIMKVYAGICYMHMFCAEDVFWSYKATFHILSVVQNWLKKRTMKCQRSVAHLEKYLRLIDPFVNRAKADLIILQKKANSGWQNKEQENKIFPLVTDIDTGLSQISSHISELLTNAQCKLSSANWLEIDAETQAENWMTSIKKLVEDVDKVYIEMSKNKHLAQSILEDLIHVAKKQQVTDSLDMIRENFSKLKAEREKLHSALNDWISENYGKFKEIKKYQKDLALEEDNSLDEGMLKALEQLKVLNTNLAENCVDQHSVACSTETVDMDVINNEVISLENVLQDLLSLVEEGDQKLLKTKEIFDELTIRQF